MMQIGVIGGREAEPSLLAAAEETGRLIAERGALLLCGGMGGIMEAACRGAVRAGGQTLGILPGSDARSGNEFLTVTVPSGLGIARNVLIVQASDGIIAVGGRYGTLSEMAHARQLNKPLVSLHSWVFDDSVPAADSAAAAVELLFSMLVKPV